MEIGAGSGSGLVTIYAYDLGRRTTSVDDGFACTTETFDYRDLPLITTSGLAGGSCADAADKQALTHAYDGLGRLTRSEVTYPVVATPDRSVDDVFDAIGNRRIAGVRVDGIDSASVIGVNLLDQVSIESRADGSTSKSAFDPAGNASDACYWAPSAAVGECYPVGTTPWSNAPTSVTSTGYDARNQRVSLLDAAASSTTTYDPDHNYAIKGVYRATGNGRESQALYTYDALHRLTGISFQTCAANTSHACTDAPVSNGSDIYTYDNNDNRTQVLENNQAATSDRRYCYDARNQLTHRNTGTPCSPSTNDEAWTYDSAGNRLSAVSGGTSTNFAYSTSGLLCDVETGISASCAGGNVSHDTAGRLTNWNGWTFAYDPDSRLTSACKSPTCVAGSDKVEFSYDAEGHRTRITATSAGGTTTTTEFRYQGDVAVEEKVNGTVVRQYVTTLQGAISKVIVPAGQPSAGTYLVNWNGHGDALNLLRVNGDGTTTLANSYTYSTWGVPTTVTHNGIGDLAFRFLYLGQSDMQWDAMFGLNLHFAHARHYSPLLGRFLQPDPGGLGTPTYGYAMNSPITYGDPSGHWWELAWPGGGGGGGGLLYWIAYWLSRPWTWVATYAAREWLQRAGYWWRDLAYITTRHNVSLAQISAAITRGSRFEYFHRGVCKIGFYLAYLNMFVATSKSREIITAFKPTTGRAYIDNLRSYPC